MKMITKEKKVEKRTEAAMGVGEKAATAASRESVSKTEKWRKREKGRGAP